MKSPASLPALFVFLLLVEPVLAQAPQKKEFTQERLPNGYLIAARPELRNLIA